MYCAACGNQAKNDAKFCTRCAQPLRTRQALPVVEPGNSPAIEQLRSFVIFDDKLLRRPEIIRLADELEESELPGAIVTNGNSSIAVATDRRVINIRKSFWGRSIKKVESYFYTDIDSITAGNGITQDPLAIAVGGRKYRLEADKNRYSFAEYVVQRLPGLVRLTSFAADTSRRQERSAVSKYFDALASTSQNPDGPLLGEEVVFTGDTSIPRGRLAYTSAAAGCKVAQRVTESTTILVLGTRNSGYAGKSMKHIAALDYSKKFRTIKIFDEKSFLEKLRKEASKVEVAVEGTAEAIVLDVETTGLDPKEDRIVSVAAILTNLAEDNPEEAIKVFWCNPLCSIPNEAELIHGITDADVEDSPLFADIAQELRDFIGNYPIIAHNVKFDKSFLDVEFKRAGVKTLRGNKSFCTMDRYALEPNGRPFTSLDEVADTMGVEGRSTSYHGAKEDAIICRKIASVFYKADWEGNAR